MGSKQKRKSTKITLLELIALSIAFFGSIRNIPQVGAVGWSSIVWMALIVLFFAVPIGLIAAELGTGWAKRGGIATWVRVALGEKAGSLVSWLIWTQMFVGMAFIGVALSTAFSVGIDDPYQSYENLANYGSYFSGTTHLLYKDPIFIVFFVLLVTWGIIALNLWSTKFAGKIQNVSTIIGIYVPAALFVICGIIFFSTHLNGINEADYSKWGLGDIFGVEFQGYYKALEGFRHPHGIDFISPDGSGNSLNALGNFSNILFIFVGIEIAATRANDIENPRRNYPIALFCALIFMIFINVVGGLLTSFIITPKVAGGNLMTFILLPFQVIFKSWNAPWLVNIVALFIAVGTFAQLSAWVLGPSNAVYQSAIEGNYPPFFQKTIVRGGITVPINIIILQGFGISFFALLYSILIGVGNGFAFFLLLNLTVDLYMFAYVLMLISAIVLRYKSTTKDVVRPFRVGKCGNLLMVILVIMGALGVLTAIAMTLVPQSTTDVTQIASQYVVLIVVSALLIGIWAFIRYYKKSTWRDASKLDNDSSPNDEKVDLKEINVAVNSNLTNEQKVSA